ncbi:NAD(P)/FAD-dependent oxidoreductase, partial [bacterium]|nr:NAD(P)/FAD-dependent oxidoreductase [bacterium]
MKYVIIGNGVAGMTAAETIRKADSEGSITVITEEAVPFYSRIRLIDYLAGDAGLADITIKSEDWHRDNRIELMSGSRVVEIKKDPSQVITEQGNVIDYDRLLIAAGGISFIPPIPGVDKKGVFALRTLQDADAILEYAGGMDSKKIILIGGGVLGLEAGNSLRKRGYEVTVVEFFPRLLPRQMDPDGAGVLKAQMEQLGFSFYLDAKSKEITGGEVVDGLLLEDGTLIEGGLVIVSAGVRPRAELAAAIGLTVSKGVVVNDRMETEVPEIFAAGDLIEHKESFYGIWPAAQKQGQVAGTNMAGGDAIYEGTTMSNMLKVVGIDLAAAGDIDADSKLEAIVLRNQDSFVYRKLVLNGNTIVGCIMYGDISGYRKVLKAIEEKRDISAI